MRFVRDSNELKESEAGAAFRQISILNVLLETSKEVQMLHGHYSMRQLARSFLLRQESYAGVFFPVREAHIRMHRCV